MTVETFDDPNRTEADQSAAQFEVNSGEKSPEQLFCLGLGSNIDAENNMPQAVSLLRQFVIVEAISTFWETAAVGSSAPNYINAALLIRSSLSPQDLKQQVLRLIEARLGRVRTNNKYAPRTIDIDIVIAGCEVIDPLLWTQSYLAVPVAELLPDLICPETGGKLSQVATQLKQEAVIQPRPDIVS